MSKLKKIFIFLLVTGYWSLVTFNAFAYVLNGQDWTYQSDPMQEYYYINPNCRDTSCGTTQNQIDAINTGARAWNNEGNANFKFRYGGVNTSVTDTGEDGTNINVFVDYDPDGDPNIVARASYWYYAANGDIYETDTIFNDHTFTWNTVGNPSSSEEDVWNATAHELGHWLSLGHSDISQATMYFTINKGETNDRDLHPDDIAGIQAIYGKAPNTNPVLETGRVNPGSGNEGITNFVYRVHYYDADGDAPSQNLVYIDGNSFTMSLESGSASDGTYKYETTLGAGAHFYYFYFQDTQGGDDKLPVIEPSSGPTVNTVPDIDVKSSVTRELIQGTTAKKTVKIYNLGSANLVYDISDPVVGWLSIVKNQSGTVLPGGMLKVVLKFDARGYGPGKYTTSLKITNTDPDESTLYITVKMKVIAP